MICNMKNGKTAEKTEKKEDKRVIKTKRNLKETLIRLLDEKPFEKLTVTEICKEAQTSRITFYTYYGDKYDLLQELYSDMNEVEKEVFCDLQKKNNPKNDTVRSYMNLVTSIIEKYRRYGSFFQHINPMSRDDLWTTYGSFILNNFPEIETGMGRRINPAYSEKQLNVFLVTGFWGYLLTGIHDGRNLDELEKETQNVMKDLINSNLFVGTKRF